MWIDGGEAKHFVSIYPAGTDIMVHGGEPYAVRFDATREDCDDIPREDYTVVFS